MNLTLRMDSLLVVDLWIYSSYNAHDYCRGHTGFMVSLGKGGVLSLSLKHNMNVKISTEGKLVGSHNGIIVLLWIKNSVEYQGYTVKHNKLYQYNKSIALMKNNG